MASTPTRAPEAPSARTQVRRLPERARYDRATVHAILDEGLLCHVAVAEGGTPAVIPMVYARVDDVLYLHGSPASGVMRALARGAEACVTVTLLDGLVLARSAFHHSVNYRAVVLFGRGREVQDMEEKRRALEAVVEHVVPGRTRDARGPNDFELRYTRVAALALDEASAKVRSGPPKDDAEDLALPVWAGELPLHLAFGPPLAAPDLDPAREAPPYVTGYRRPDR